MLLNLSMDALIQKGERGEPIEIGRLRAIQLSEKMALPNRLRIDVFADKVYDHEDGRFVVSSESLQRQAFITRSTVKTLIGSVLSTLT